MRSEAARSLGVLNSKKATSFLIKSLRKDTNAEVRMYAAHAFGLLHDERALEPLVETLSDTEENPKVRGMAAETLGSMCDERAILPLIKALSDHSVEVRFWSAFALGELGAVQALPELERLLNVDNESLPGQGSIKQEASAAIKAIQSSLNADEK